MLKGVIIFEQGGMQQIGELSSLQGIINTMKIALPELEAKEADRVLQSMSDAELEQILIERKKGTMEKIK